MGSPAAPACGQHQQQAPFHPVALRLRPQPLHSQQAITQATASVVEFGWTASPDAWNSLNGLFHTHDKSGFGTFNAGRYSNHTLDTLIDNIRIEPDLTRRRAMVTTVLRIVAEDLPFVPLYRRTLTWAMAKNVQAVQWPNDTLELRWVRVK